VIRAQRFAAPVALSGAVFLVGWVAGWLAGFGPPGIENTHASPMEGRGAQLVLADVASAASAARDPAALPASVALSYMPSPAPAAPELATAPATRSVRASAADPDPPTPPFILGAPAAAEVPDASLPDLPALPSLETRVQLASFSASDPAKEHPTPALRPVEILNECLVAEICIDEYLWSLYQRTPKLDTNKVTERIKETVKKKGKTRTAIKIVTRYVAEDFTWKDPIAAQKAGMSLMDYVIGGMDRGFRLKLYRALRAMDEVGLMPGITSAFRDDYRQSITSGNKAASDNSYHGGSRHGGYGHGLAADLVSVKGETRTQRYASNEELWKWIDLHEEEIGIGRPYLDRDPPHVAPIDGKEFADKRGRGKAEGAGLQIKDAQTANLETKKPWLAARDNSGGTKHANPPKSSKVSSPQNRTNLQR